MGSPPLQVRLAIVMGPWLRSARNWAILASSAACAAASLDASCSLATACRWLRREAAAASLFVFRVWVGVEVCVAVMNGAFLVATAWARRQSVEMKGHHQANQDPQETLTSLWPPRTSRRRP